MSLSKIPNHSGTDHCDSCADTGWCILTTTTRIRGVTYPDGVAPCRWCEQGALRYAHQDRLVAERRSRVQPTSRFDETTIELRMTDEHYHPLPDADCAQRLAALTRRYQRSTAKRSERFSGGEARPDGRRPTNRGASPPRGSQPPLVGSERP